MYKSLSAFIFSFIAICLPTISHAYDLNKIKNSCQCIQCDLTGINLKNYRPALGDANPICAKSLAKAENSIIQMNSTTLVACNFSGTNFTRANLINTNFNQNSAIPTCVKNANFEKANFNQANLSGAILSWANISYANFSHANLMHTNLYMVNAEHANFGYANLFDLHADVKTMGGLVANMSFANFEHANLDEARLAAALYQANFSYASLHNTKLLVAADTASTAKLNDDNIVQANFSHANLIGATIKTVDGTKIIDKNQQNPALLKQMVLCQTIMPDGSINNRDCNKNQQTGSN